MPAFLTALLSLVLAAWYANRLTSRRFGVIQRGALGFSWSGWLSSHIASLGLNAQILTMSLPTLPSTPSLAPSESNSTSQILRLRISPSLLRLPKRTENRALSWMSAPASIMLSTSAGVRRSFFIMPFGTRSPTLIHLTSGGEPSVFLSHLYS